MLEKTIGVVLSITPYNDKSSFVLIYTEKFGRVTYSVPTVKSKKAKLSRSLFTPLSILEMEVEHRQGVDIQKISEARMVAFHLRIMGDPIKCGVALFLAELVARAVREQEQNKPLFEFLQHSIELYELMEDGFANFHLVFLLRLSDFIGIRVSSESYQVGAYFDLLEGEFVLEQPVHTYYLSVVEALAFYHLLEISYANMSDFSYNRNQRNRLTETLILYYKLHLPDFKEVKSFEVLKMLFG